MCEKVELAQLLHRRKRFIQTMNQSADNWDTAIILSKVNQYYLTGTMQDGMLLIRNNGEIFYFVRRSYERAKDESTIAEIYPMESYRDAATSAGKICGNTYVETEVITLAILNRLQKHFQFDSINSLDKIILSQRAVKSPYELAIMERAGGQHDEFLRNVVPSLLREGMSEADLVAEMFEKKVKFGHQGIARFSMFQNEIVVGQIGFGESSLYPTSFDGPGGAYGMSPAVPLLGSRERKLKPGDLVFVDTGYGISGYHSDKTQVYSFGAKPPQEVIEAHNSCINVQNRLAELLKPNAIPSEVYNTVMSELGDDFKQNFMGFGARQVKFLGHGVGLHIDELPIIADGYQQPLEENMVIALEPKKGVAALGMVGVEDTYVVTPEGGRCINGGGREIIVVQNRCEKLD